MAVEDTTTEPTEVVDTPTVVDEAEQAEQALADDTTGFEDFDDEDTEESEEDDTEEIEESEEEETAEETENDSEEEAETEGEGEEDTQEEEEDTSSTEQKDAARLAYEKREAAREQREIDKRNAEQKYIDEAPDDENRALRQVQVESYRNNVRLNEGNLQNGMDKAVASIPELRTGSKAVKDELIASLDDFEKLYVVRDKNGDPIEVKADVHAYLQKKAESVRRLTSTGASEERKAKKVTKARTDIIPTRAPKEPKKDAVLDGFDDEAKRY